MTVIPPQAYSVLLFAFVFGYGGWTLYTAARTWWDEWQLERSLDGIEVSVNRYYQARAHGDEDAMIESMAALSEYMGRR